MRGNYDAHKLYKISHDPPKMFSNSGENCINLCKLICDLITGLARFACVNVVLMVGKIVAANQMNYRVGRRGKNERKRQ